MTTDDLIELNNRRCSDHNKAPEAKYHGEDINFEYCGEKFKQEIIEFVREKTLKHSKHKLEKVLG